MDKKITVTGPGVSGRTLIGYVHPNGVKWLSKNQNTGSSIQLLGAPTEDSNLAVYADAVPSAETPTAVDVDQVEINPADLRLESWRKNRGGWDTRPDNCCRLTHVPSGITVTVEGDADARSVHAAKAMAMHKLKEELVRRAAGGGALNQTGLADRVAAVLSAHGISVRADVCEEVAREVVAAAGPVLTKSAFNEVVKGWDGVICTDNFVSDIGADLRKSFDRHATPASGEFMRDREAERQSIGNDAFNGWLDTKLHSGEETVWEALAGMTLTEVAWSGWLYRNTFGTAPEQAAAAEALTDNLAALVRKLAYCLGKASPDHPEVGRAVSYLKRKGLVGSPLRLADKPVQMPADVDIHNVLQDAANLAHSYGHPELYAKLKRLTSALAVRLSSVQVAEIARDAATTVLPLYVEDLTELALTTKVQQVVTEAITRAAGHYGDLRHKRAVYEVARLHTVVNAVAVRLREANLETLAAKLEDHAATVEIVLRAPVVAPTQL